MEVKPIKYAEVFASQNAAELLRKYGEECSISLIGPIDPQPQMYASMEAIGLAQCFGAFDGDKLVGFASVLMTILPHYGKKVATMESLFVDDDHRCGGVGDKLIKEVNRFSKNSGCETILYSAPTGSRFSRLLALSGECVKTNVVYCRRLA